MNDREALTEPDINKRRGYIHGCPTSKIVAAFSKTVVKDFLINERGLTNVYAVTFAKVSDLNEHFQVMVYLQNRFTDWYENANIMTIGSSIYKYYQWEIYAGTPSPITAATPNIISDIVPENFPISTAVLRAQDPEIGSIRIILQVSMSSGNDPDGSNTFDIFIAPIELSNVLLVKYYDKSVNGNHIHYYTQLTDQELEDLNTASGTIDIEDSFYPICLLRENFKFVNDTEFREQKGVQWKYYDKSLKSTSRLVKKLGFKLDDIIDGISGDTIDKDQYEDKAGGKTAEEQAEDARKEAKKGLESLSTVNMIFAADIYSDEEDTIEYLYTFFKNYSDSSGSILSNAMSLEFSDAGGNIAGTYGYNQKVKWRHCRIKEVTGDLYDKEEKRVKVPIKQITNKNKFVTLIEQGGFVTLPGTGTGDDNYEPPGFDDVILCVVFKPVIGQVKFYGIGG